MVQGVAFYTIFVYFPTYFSRYFEIPADSALLSNTLSMILLNLLILPCAFLSDQVGRKPLFLLSLLAYALSAFFFNQFLIPKGYFYIVLSHLTLAFISGFFMSVLPVTLAELFPVKIRNTSFSVLYNLSLALLVALFPQLPLSLLKKRGFLISREFIFLWCVFLL